MWLACTLHLAERTMIGRFPTWTLSSTSGVGLSSWIIWKSKCTGEKYVSFRSLHSNGVAGCSAPFASLIVGLPR